MHPLRRKRLTKGLSWLLSLVGVALSLIITTAIYFGDAAAREHALRADFWRVGGGARGARRVGGALPLEVRIFHISHEQHGNWSLIDAHLSPHLDYIQLVFAEEVPIYHHIMCGGALANLSAQPLLGPEPGGVPLPPDGNASTLPAPKLPRPWWHFLVNCELIYEKLFSLSCALPPAVTAELWRERALATAAMAASTQLRRASRTGLVIELCDGSSLADREAQTCTPSDAIPVRTLAVDAGPPTAPHFLAIWSLLYQKQDELIEWIAYYRALGVEHFYLYDQMSSDGTYARLLPLVASGIVTLTRLNYSSPQQCVKGAGPGTVQDFCVNHLLSRWGAFNRWLLLVDVDEYIVLKTSSASSAEFPAAMKWLRNHGGDGIAPPTTIPELLRAVNATAAGDDPPFSALQINSFKTWCSLKIKDVFGARLDLTQCDINTNFEDFLPEVEFARYAKLLMLPSRVPYHGSMHILTSGDRRMLTVNISVAVILHLQQCHGSPWQCAGHCSLDNADPKPYLLACAAATRRGRTELTNELAVTPFLERVPAQNQSNSAMEFNDGSGRPAAFQTAALFAPLLGELYSDAVHRSARCATANTFFRNQFAR